MDQIPSKLCYIVRGNKKELRKTQIFWTFRISSWYHYKVAQDMCDPVHSQPEKTHMGLQSWYGSTIEHTLTHIWNKPHCPIHSLF